MSLNKRLLLIGLLFGYGLFLWLVAVNLRIDGDESKYYTTIKEVSDSGLSLKNFHQGSAGFYFYKIHTAWAYLFGIGYEVGRALNIALTIGALALMFFGLRRLFNSDFIPFFWLIAFGCNPFFATHSVQISHYAVSTALLLAAVGSMILYATSNRLSGRALVPVVLIAIFLVVAANVRDHLWPAWGISAVFLVLLSKQAGSRAMLRVLGVYLLTSVLIGSIPLMTHSSPLSERDAAFASMARSSPLSERDAALASLSEAKKKIQVSTEKARFLQLLNFLSTNGAIRVETLLQSLNPLTRQAAGFEVNGQHIFYLVPLVLALIHFREMNGLRRQSFLYSLLLLMGVGLPVFAYRYSQSSSFSYFLPSVQLLLIAGLFGVDLIKKRLDQTESRTGSAVLIAIVGLVALQNLFFIRPVRENDSPTYSIYKRYGSEANPYEDSLFNIRAAAKVANKHLRGRDDLFLTSAHSLSPMLAGAPFPGTIMNIHDDFFAKLFWDQSNGYAVTWSGRRFDPKNWYAAVLRPQFDIRGTNASYMVNIAIRQKYLAVIIDNGDLHEDLMPVLLQYYRLADHYENYKFYVPK